MTRPWIIRKPAAASKPSFLSYGQKTERAIVLLHGYTSSPRMYHRLAERLFRRGFNVLVPLAPLHGLNDRMSTALAGLSQEMLVGYLNEAVDIAHGLGARVGLAGFSMGGVLALWAAR
jgi:carboxylesterase